ncbi:MAG: arsenite methyltransferase [Rhodospirillales bacterium]|nr:arsenite methyltransferase [Rhodospirillales bacterium]
MSMETEIKQVVRERYAAAAVVRTSCCGSKSPAVASGPDLGLNIIGDAYHHVDGYLAEADLGVGCGVPTHHAGLKEGDVVLDLGSGAGIDVFVARRIVGEAGRVIGVDMTAEMIARARENAAKLGYENVEFRLGEIESLPVDSEAVDAVISNCVLNLVPNKARAFAEIFRVLRRGAHFCVADIVATGELPPPIREAAALYVGCIAGALPVSDYLRLIGMAGFEDIEVAEITPVDLPDDILAPHVEGPDIAAFRRSGVTVQSITVRATKPG